MGLRDELQAELKRLRMMKDEIGEELYKPDVYNKRKIRLVRKRAASGKDYFYGANTGGRLMKLEPQGIWTLIYREYLKAGDLRLDQDILFLEKVNKEYREYTADEIYRSLKEPYGAAFRQFDSGLLPVGEPASSASCGTPFRESGLRHLTGDGIWVRSKSEASIADHLRLNKVPYCYEPELCLGDHMIRPDFEAVSVRRNKTVYWEHFGMMDDPLYASQAAKKISLYLENEFVPFDNLIITSEKNGVLNTGTIQRAIDLVLL